MNDFDPYLAWLDIPPHHRPAQPWRLLRVSPHCSDPATIRNAAQAALNRIVQAAQGDHQQWVQRLQGEVQAAEQSLLAGAATAQSASPIPPPPIPVSTPTPPQTNNSVGEVALNPPAPSSPQTNQRNASPETPLRPPFRSSQVATPAESPLNPPAPTAAPNGIPPAGASQGMPINAPPPPGTRSQPSPPAMAPPPASPPAAIPPAAIPPAAKPPTSIPPISAHAADAPVIFESTAVPSGPESTAGSAVPVESPVLSQPVSRGFERNGLPTEQANQYSESDRERALSPLLIAAVSISCFLFGVLLMVLFILLR